MPKAKPFYHPAGAHALLVGYTPTSPAQDLVPFFLGAGVSIAVQAAMERAGHENALHFERQIMPYMGDFARTAARALGRGMR